MAATMLGQGKNTWQAEIDAAAEVSLLSFVEEKKENLVEEPARRSWPLG